MTTRLLDPSRRDHHAFFEELSVAAEMIMKVQLLVLRLVLFFFRAGQCIDLEVDRSDCKVDLDLGALRLRHVVLTVHMLVVERQSIWVLLSLTRVASLNLTPLEEAIVIGLAAMYDFTFVVGDHIANSGT